jgi:hypothetical protein
MTRQKIPKPEGARYYRAAADFWYEAVGLQQSRCLEESGTSIEGRADLNFYVVAVQRLCEVAHMAHKRLGIEGARQLLTEFDERWPRFRELRNQEEHILGPSGGYPSGIWYFGDVVADLQPGGGVEYIVSVRDMEPGVHRLYESLRDLLDAEQKDPQAR